MEFENPMSDYLVDFAKILGDLNQMIYLEEKDSTAKIYPSKLNVKRSDDNILDAKFAPNRMKKSKCYSIKINPLLASD
jgi:hypothetical protein